MDSSHTLLSISLIKGVGNVALKLFNEHCKTDVRGSMKPEIIVNAFKELKQTNKRVKEIHINDIEDAFFQAEKIINNSYKKEIDIITINDSEYPKLLQSIKNPPLILHLKGNINALTIKPTIAVIGTRTPSEYGIRLGKRISKILVENNFTIVSGLALGCDTLGHQAAINAHSQTIAVLAGGLDDIYPKENRLLAEEIINNDGLLLSEYPIGTKPSRASFVNRDRIQSGLSLSTLIIQTSEKGGTLHTAKYTQEQQRILACTATDDEIEMNHEQFKGNKNLIRLGALKLANKEQVTNFINKTLQYQSDFMNQDSQTTLTLN